MVIGIIDPFALEGHISIGPILGDTLESQTTLKLINLLRKFDGFLDVPIVGHFKQQVQRSYWSHGIVHAAGAFAHDPKTALGAFAYTQAFDVEIDGLARFIVQHDLVGDDGGEM